jgi:stage V sporulation protein B
LIKKDSLIKGTIILAVAAFIARFLGIAQQVPLYHILGNEGNSLFRLANNLYLTLLPLATAGIPSALSKLIAEKTALGRQSEAEQLFRAAIRFAIVAGVVITVPLVVLAPLYARWAKLPDATIAIWAIAPALLLFPVIAMLRGYFQGRQMMMAGGLSQIWEQLFRVVTAVGFAAALFALGKDLDWVAAGASFGGVLGAFAALVVMLLYLRKLRRADREQAILSEKTAIPDEPPMRTRTVFMSLVKLSIPISLFSSTVSLINLIDNSIGVPLLMGQMGIEAATDELGALVGKAQSLAGISVVFAIAVSQSLVPVVSAAFSRGDMDEVRHKSRQALLLALLTGLPVVAILAAGAQPINQLLFGDASGTQSIALLSVATLFQILMMTSGAILMGIGRMKMLMANLAVCVGLKLVLSFALAKPFGMTGIILATGLCYLASVVMNVIYLQKSIGFVFLQSKWRGMGLTLAGLISTGIAVERLNRLVVAPFPGDFPLAAKLNELTQTTVAGLIMGGAFLVLLFATRVITKNELANLPGPFQKLLKKVGIQNRRGVETNAN